MPGLVYALLVGIDSYPNPAHRLAGCRNDALEFEGILRLRTPSDVLRLEKLLDEEATRARVIDRFSRHLGQAGKGDSAVFFYAGHGSQERAPEEFWTVEPDRLDETLVLWDSRQPGHWDLADKELAALIREVAARGPHVALILDCCHSGSGTRAPSERRAERVRRFPSDDRIRPLDTFLPQAQAAVHRSTESGWDLGEAGRHILLAACRDAEEAAEYTGGGRKRGAFSYHLLQALRESSGTVTYRDLAAGARLRVAATVSNQTPQIEAIRDDDLDLPFLGGAVQPRARAFVVSEDNGEWWMDGGRIHGIPAPVGAEAARVSVFSAGAPAPQASAIAEIVQVEPARSLLRLTRSALESGKDYRATLVSVPLPGRTVRLEGECDAVRGSIAASPYVTESGAEAEFLLECRGGEYHLRRAADGRLLTAPALTPEDAVRNLEHIARWTSFAELGNPASAIAEGEIEVKLFSGTSGNVELPGTDLRLTAARSGQQLAAPRFRLRIANHGARPLYAGVLALDELFACSTDLIPSGVVRLEPGQELWALDGKALKSAIPEALRKEGRTESRDILKILVSTADFEIRHAVLHALSAPGGTRAPLPVGGSLERLLARGRTRTISADSDDEQAQDFRTYTVLVTTVEPKAGVALSGAGVADLGAGVRIDPHPSLQAEARLATVAETRSDLGGSILPPMLRNAFDGCEPITFTSGRGSSPGLSVLELRGISDYRAVTPDEPLVVHLPSALEAGDVAAAVGYDGEDYLLLGRGAAEGTGTVVRISRLPHPVAEQKRSLTGSVKILFQKFASSVLGARYEYPVLAAATWNGAKKPTYDKDNERIKARIAGARRVVLFVHGIIGDTLAMGARLTPGPDDAFLTFDYENLHTTIEQNAEGLKRRLIDHGLGEGHGKELVIVAHSMGGLISRWFIEHLGGNRIVSRLILCGTPNGGSPWSSIEDWITGAASLALNQLTGVSWEAAAIGHLVAGLERIDNSLDEMKPGSQFLKSLEASQEPGIRYTVLAGNTSLAGTADGGRVSRVLKKVLHRTTSWAFLFEPNDIAASVASIEAVGENWSGRPEKHEVACDHISYFASDAGLQALRKLLEA